MKIFILGNGNSIFIKQYIEYILLPTNHEIFLSDDVKINSEYRNFYKKNRIKLLPFYSSKSILSKIPKIGSILSAYFNLHKLKKYRIDYLHIHNVTNNRILSVINNCIFKSFKNVVLTYWGSDILDINETKANYVIGILKKSKNIILPTIEMRRKFFDYYGDQFEDKITSCLFGNPSIETIIKYENGEIELPAIDNILPVGEIKNKYIISLGYNASPRHQHKRILEEINKLKSDLKNKIYCVVQMSYPPGQENYIGEIEEFMSMNSINGIVLRKFLSVKETIVLKKSVDLFIHGQTTDALSSSIIEYLCLGCLVFNPTWIQYPELKSLDIKYIEYNDFSDLVHLIEKAMNNQININVSVNSAAIKDNFRWQMQSPCWLALYK